MPAFCAKLLHNYYPVLLLQTAFVYVLPDVVHTSYSWSSFCTRTSHFHLQRLLHLIFLIHPQHVSIPAQPGLHRFQCDVFRSQIDNLSLSATPCMSITLTICYVPIWMVQNYLLYSINHHSRSLYVYPIVLGTFVPLPISPRHANISSSIVPLLQFCPHHLHLSYSHPRLSFSSYV